MLESLDKIDKKILYELDSNSRQSIASVAKNSRCSRTVAEYRIKKFIENGIIFKFSALIDPAKFGLTSWKVYMQFFNREPIQKQVTDFLQSTKNVWWIAKCEGSFDVMFSILTKNVHEFYRFLSDFQMRFSKHVLRVEITTHINTEFYSRVYLLDKPSLKIGDTILRDPRTENIDKKDIEILKIISENSRFPSTEIASKINTTARIVNYRISDLKKRKIITHFRVIPDVNKLGMDYYKVMISLKDITTEKINSIRRFFEIHPNIINSSNSWGPWDIEFEAEVENFKHLTKIINEIRTKFSDVIKKTEFVLIYEELKATNNFLSYMGA